MFNKIKIIYSSHLSEYNDDYFNNNIKNTIGNIEYSIHRYVNNNKYSLSEIYNKAIKENNEKDTILVFCHNDIVFKTDNWGVKLLKKFNYNNYQILGVAGTTYLSESGIWWDFREKMHGIVEHTNNIRNWTSVYSNDPIGSIVNVSVVDGLFIAVDCNNINNYWDEDFKGFHFYDISFCFSNLLNGINIGVMNDIRILHKSIGITNDEWEKNRNLFIKKYGNELPFNIENYDTY